ncbi:MAG: hypothetical protein U5O39_14010 [Gammaproteobacteria bacterium]|nr:hypothetical protein [Gammaproteobacteria bacterium]
MLLTLCASLLAGVELSQCSKIDSAVERLDCYDGLAARHGDKQGAQDNGGKIREKHDVAEDAEPESIPIEQSAPCVTGASEAPAGETEIPKEGGCAAADDEEETFGIQLFGKPRSDPDRGESIRSTIESVRDSPAGNRVMTLANGQIWMEREAGRRSIDPSQDVVILKRRWHYSMLLIDQNRRVTVQRID